MHDISRLFCATRLRLFNPEVACVLQLMDIPAGQPTKFVGAGRSIPACIATDSSQLVRLSTEIESWPFCVKCRCHCYAGLMQLRARCRSKISARFCRIAGRGLAQGHSILSRAWTGRGHDDHCRIQVSTASEGLTVYSTS